MKDNRMGGYLRSRVFLLGREGTETLIGATGDPF